MACFRNAAIWDELHQLRKDIHQQNEGLQETLRDIKERQCALDALLREMHSSENGTRK